MYRNVLENEDSALDLLNIQSCEHLLKRTVK